MRGAKASSLLLLLISAVCFAADKKCYFPSGLEAKDDYPCDPDAEDSACCGRGPGVACSTNKLCVTTDGSSIRGSCTDKNWDSPECPKFCMGAIYGGHDLISCSNVTKTDTSYCCDRARGFCCDDGVGRFEVLPPRPQLWALWDVEATAYVVVERERSSSSSSTPDTTTAKQTAIETETETKTKTTRAPPTETEPASSSSLPLAALIGIIVGVCVLVIAIAVIAFLWFKLRKKEALLAEVAEKDEQQQQQQQKLAGDWSEDDPYKIVAPAPAYPYQVYPVEVHGNSVVTEAHGRPIMFELPATPAPPKREGWV
ncbi:hypothetical protein C7999DRAFT_11997 [Corynascus novoguineensis]|uniref:Uncharacterized protein n=1 Tax=Corynascus novoguineensis TaxID=1126955 RepID=A0AAN7D093_9PEZI|nr:hypothetical protein C7999DRAFT_11997 [Corynascus novoguineensis]